MKETTIVLGLLLCRLCVFSQVPPQDKNWEVVFENDYSNFPSEWYISRGVHNAGDPFTEAIGYDTCTNVAISDGKLRLAVKREQAPYCADCIDHYLDYTVSAVLTNIQYRYGYFEIYSKIPASNGYWPAFWLWSSNEDIANSTCSYNEIDIFETLGYCNDSIRSNVHWDFVCPIDLLNDTNTRHYCRYDTSYHWYGLEWDSSKITWYIDEKIVRQTLNNFYGIGIQNPMQILITFGLDKFNVGLNDVDENTIFPGYMYVDQANVYRLKCDSETVVNEIQDFDSFYFAVKKSITLSGNTTIPPSSNLSLRATDYVLLTNGFEVPIGAEFYADVNPCP